MVTLQALTCFDGNNDQNNATVWSCATSPLHLLKRASPKSKPDLAIQLNCRDCTLAGITLESFDHQEALKVLLLSDELCLIMYLALLILL